MTTQETPEKKKMGRPKKVDDGLTPNERELLSEIALTGSWSKAADNLGLPPGEVRRLLRKPAFKQAYDQIVAANDELQIAKQELDLIASGLGELYEEALQAEKTKKVSIECPKCNHRFPWLIEMMDWATKLRAAETLAKMAKLLRDEKNIKVEGEIVHKHVPLTVGQYLALERVSRGQAIAPHVHAELIRLGKERGFEVPALPEYKGGVIDADFREVEDEDNTDE